jgi:hypothetical protein
VGSPSLSGKSADDHPPGAQTKLSFSPVKYSRKAGQFLHAIRPDPTDAARSGTCAGCGVERSCCLIHASIAGTKWQNADSARRCRFRKSQQKRASDLDSIDGRIPKLDVAGSNPVSRSINKGLIRFVEYDVTTISLLVPKGAAGEVLEHLPGKSKTSLPQLRKASKTETSQNLKTTEQVASPAYASLSFLYQTVSACTRFRERRRCVP